MRFYRVGGFTSDGHQGYAWFTERREAERCARDFVKEHTVVPDPAFSEELVSPLVPDIPEVETIEIEPTKQGILKALKLYASHAENG